MQVTVSAKMHISRWSLIYIGIFRVYQLSSVPTSTERYSPGLVKVSRRALFASALSLVMMRGWAYFRVDLGLTDSLFSLTP